MEDYRDYRGYDNRDYREDDFRSYRDDYRNNRDYRRGRRSNRNYRDDYYEELEMACDEMREQYRNLEDIAEMSSNPQEKQMLMKVAQAEKENYHNLKQMMSKSM